MKIVEKENAYTLLEDLKAGDCFLFKGAIYMKISAKSSMCSFNAVHLRCGSVRRLGDKACVKPIDCELHYLGH